MNEPFNPDAPVAGQWAILTSAGIFSVGESKGDAVRIDKVTKSGRVKVREKEFRREIELFVHRGPRYGRFNMRDTTILRPATLEQIVVAVAQEQVEAARIERMKRVDDANRARLTGLDWASVEDYKIRRIAEILGWKDEG